jgi:hypothetical protein
MMKMEKTSFLHWCGILILILMLVFNSGCISEDKDKSKPKEPKEPDNGYEWPTPEVSAVVEDKGSYFKIEFEKIINGSLSLEDTRFKLFNSNGTPIFNVSTNRTTRDSVIQIGNTHVYPIPLHTLIGVYENYDYGDGENVDKESMEYPQIWMECFLAYLDANNNEKVYYGDSIWIFKSWYGKGHDSITSNFNFIIEYNGDIVLNKSLSDNDGPLNKGASSINIVDKGNYWNLEIKNKNNISFESDQTHFQIYSQFGFVKFSNHITIGESWKDRRYTIGNSTFHIYGNRFLVPYENSTNGTGEKIDSDSLKHPEVWEGCIFVFIDSQSDELVNSGDIFWAFKDWNDDDIDEVIPTDKVWIFDYDKGEMIIKNLI